MGQRNPSPGQGSVLPSRDVLRSSIEGALEELRGPKHRAAVLSASQAAGGRSLVLSAVQEGRPVPKDEHPALAADVLDRARKELDRLPPDPIAVAGFVNTDDIALSLVLTQIAEKHAAPLPPPRPGVLKDITGVKRYELLDPGWWGSLANRLVHKRVGFIAHSSPLDFRVEIAEERLSLALVGDWGTGLPSSQAIARHMTALNPAFTIHLGDVYYSGTTGEVKSRFLPDWPAGAIGTFAINSNHEMYAGGEGYFGITLKQAPFRLQKASYFCLSTPGWQIIGLDSAYEASDLLYQKGRLSEAQIGWLKAQLAEGARRGQRSIVLTHHNPLPAHEGARDDGLLNQMLEAANPNPFDFWYWAHEHVAARFAPYGAAGRQFLGRCVGHGGVPYAPETAGKKKDGGEVEWTETELAGDPDEPRRAKNGFVSLVLDSGTRKAEEAFIDEFGVEKKRGSF